MFDTVAQVKQAIENYYIERTMTHQLMETPQMSEEIVAKLVNDYVRRYQLKEELSVLQFNSDSNRLIAQLQLYGRSLLQLRSISPQNCLSLDLKYNDVTIKVITFLTKMVEKLQLKTQKPHHIVKPVEAICEGCSFNLNTKKVESIKKQLFDYLPMFGKEWLEEDTQKPSLIEDTVIMDDEELLKKMGKLQRNLYEKQLGLMRCIDEFQDFRTNLLVGIPKNIQDRKLQDRFNTKEYTFKLAQYFSENIKKVQEKISNLKSLCKLTKDGETQCNIKQSAQEQALRASAAENTKLAAMRAETEIRKLTEIKTRLEENIKIYKVQIKHLNGKLEQLEEDNRKIKQQVFVQKMRMKAKEVKQQSENKQTESKLKKSKEENKSGGPIGQLDIANEMLSQIKARKSQLESCGAKAEEALPYFKTTIRKALDYFINQKTNAANDRKNIFKQEDDGSFLLIPSSKKVKDRKSSKGLIPVSMNSKKQVLSRFEPNSNKQAKKKQFAIFSHQVSYKISGGIRKKGTRYHSTVSEQKVSVGGDSSTMKESSRFLYKRSTLQTEGNLKKRPMHVKLTSITSEVKQPQIDSSSHIQAQTDANNNYTEFSKTNIQNGQKGSDQQRQRQYSQLFEGNARSRGSKQKNMLKRVKKQSLTYIGPKEEPNEFKESQMQNLMKIRKIHHKTFEPQMLKSFFQPQFQPETKAQTQCFPSSNEEQTKMEEVKAEVKVQQARHARMKQIFSTLKSMNKKPFSDVSNLEEENTDKRKSHRRQTLDLEQISYLTAFFAFLAQAHIANEPLYSQVKICVFETKKEEYPSNDKEEAVFRQVIKAIIIKHRKCKKQHSLCKHLTEFLLHFNECLQN